MIVTYNGHEARAFEAGLHELAAFYSRQQYQNNLRGSDSIWLIPGTVEPDACTPSSAPVMNHQHNRLWRVPWR
jgi:hypothetical protein